MQTPFTLPLDFRYAMLACAMLLFFGSCQTNHKQKDASLRYRTQAEEKHYIETIEERAFQQRAELVLTYLADYYHPPNPNIGDPEKYYWPKAIARFHKYGPEDPIANKYVEMFHTKPPFHFTLLGQVRLLNLYPDAPAIKKHRKAYIKMALRRKDRYNPFTSEGTENHVNMARTSGYLIAELAEDYPDLEAEAKKHKKDMRKWIQHQSKKIFSMGTAEWNSSTYAPYNVMPWINLYDFARDAEVRRIARAAIDYYATELALFYHGGMIAGPEMRGSPTLRPFDNSIQHMGWLWYNDTQLNLELPRELKGNVDIKEMRPLRPNLFISIVHGATSNYRPHGSIRALAIKKEMPEQEYVLSRPNYSMSKKGFIPIKYYLKDNFTLGSAQLQYGGYSGGDSQIIPWKMTTIADSAEPLGYLMSGGGRYFRSSGGRTRDPYMQLAQHKNVLFQMHCIPQNHEALFQEVKNRMHEWQAKWERDFKQRFPDSEIPHNVVTRLHPPMAESLGYLDFNSFRHIKFKAGKIFLDWDRSFVVIHFIYNQSDIPGIQKTKKGKHYQVEDEAPEGSLCGFVIEIASAEDFASFEAFSNAVVSKTEMRTNRQNLYVEYINLSGDTLKAHFEPKGSFVEPMYDWGYGPTEPQIIIQSPPFKQPDWPIKEGFGRLAKLYVNGKLKSLPQFELPVMDGPLARLDDQVLQVHSFDDTLKVDFSGPVPVYHDE